MILFIILLSFLLILSIIGLFIGLIMFISNQVKKYNISKQPTVMVQPLNINASKTEANITNYFKFCPYCSGELKSEWAFCPFCGIKK